MTSHLRILMHVRGQMTAELAVLIVTGVAAVVFMVTYVQRSMQGNLFGATQSVGLQYDPRDPNQETRDLVRSHENVHQVVAYGMVEAETLRPADPAEMLFNLNGLTPNPCPVSGEACSAPGEMRMMFLSLPRGPVPREPAGFEGTVVQADWASQQATRYEDRK